MCLETTHPAPGESRCKDAKDGGLFTIVYQIRIVSHEFDVEDDLNMGLNE